MPPTRSPEGLSPPFAHREFNGTGLLQELQSLRENFVTPRLLSDCAVALRPLARLGVAEAQGRFHMLAQGRGTPPALASLIVQWFGKVRSEADVIAVVNHFDRLALAASLMGILPRANERLGEGGP